MTGNVLISTRSSSLYPVRATNSTTAGTAVTQPADKTATPVAGAGVIEWGHGGAESANALWLKPFGVGSATTFLMAVYGWDAIAGDQANVINQWTATLIVSATCTLGTQTGLAGGTVTSSNFYCGTIVIITGNANVSNEIISPTGNISATVKVDCPGHRYVEVLFWMNASSTSANALYRRY